MKNSRLSIQKLKNTKKALFLFVLFSIIVNNSILAQPCEDVGNYYNNISDEICGEELKTALFDLINDHTVVTYGSIWTHFESTDAIINSEDNTVVHDMYTLASESTGFDFIFGGDQCGGDEPTGEGECYKREHAFPTAYWNHDGNNPLPMYTDLNHIFPVDGRVNFLRDDIPYGEVNPNQTASYTTLNDSYIGVSNIEIPGYSGLPGLNGLVFEPTDDYKGDFARAYFYMATRYEDQIGTWQNSNSNGQYILDGSSFPGFQSDYLEMLIRWHNEDPVSQKERDRNNAVCGIQDNRNPFIDHPEYVDRIWNSPPDCEEGPCDQTPPPDVIDWVDIVAVILETTSPIDPNVIPINPIFNTEEIGLELEVFEDNVGGCPVMNFNSGPVAGNLDFNIKAGITREELLEIFVNGAKRDDLIEAILPTFNISCEYNILYLSGYIEAYQITADHRNIRELKVNATVGKQDVIEIFSPVSTIIELPLTVDATLVAAQSFCDIDPKASIAEARADLCATLVGDNINAFITLSDKAAISGAFLDNRYPSKTNVIQVQVPAGLSLFNMNLIGSLNVRSRVKAVAPVIACASTAVGNIPDNSIKVGNFTGEGGSSLPEGISIIGLNSGVNYVNPTEPLPCLNIPAPEIIVENDNCGLGIGSATITNSIDTLTYEWSDGQTGSSADMLNAGDYYCIVSTPSNCRRAFYVEITDSLQPNITLPTSVQLVDGNSLVLQATDNTDSNLTYLWSTGEISPSITVSDEGVYSVNITTQEGCVYEAATDIKLLTTCFDPCADCASFYFDESWDSTAVNLIGNAYLTDTSMVLHNSNTSQKGACWYIADRQVLSLGFTTTFDFRLSGGSGPQGGGDGFAFVIQNAQPNLVGIHGMGIGYASIPNGVAVEFDTFRNGSAGETNSNHISVQPSINGELSANHTNSLGSAYIPDELIDGEIHQFRLHYDTDSLFVFFDDSEIPIITVGNSIYDLIENVDEGVWLGFTGSTGLATQKTELFNWSFSTLCSASCDDGIQNGNETAVDCGGDCSGCQCIVIDEEYDVQCHPDGSYDVSFSFTPKSDGTSYMVYDLNDFFEELDTIYFTDDGSISELTYGPYMYGRSHSISLTNLSDSTNCFTEIEGDATCTFNESCNVSATFSDGCVNDSLVISGTITGGIGPYSIHSDIYSTVIFPDEGNTFEFTAPDCSAQSIDFTITDFTMCQYTKNIIVEFPVNGSSCLESITLYPNPVNSILNISFSELCDDSNVKIYNSLGQLIQSDILTDSGASYDVSTLPKGVYFLHIDNEEDGHVEKFIKI